MRNLGLYGTYTDVLFVLGLVLGVGHAELDRSSSMIYNAR